MYDALAVLIVEKPLQQHKGYEKIAQAQLKRQYGPKLAFQRGDGRGCGFILMPTGFQEPGNTNDTVNGKGGQESIKRNPPGP